MHHFKTPIRWRVLGAATGLLAALAVPAWAFEEAPMLQDMVKAGKLPPVDQRLPKDPMVQEVVDQTGEYGGTLRRAILGGGDQHNMVRTIGSDNLLRWDMKWQKVLPNIAKSFEVSPDATTFTFKLREGMKWSDGAPFNADDIMFWYNDVFLNPKLTPVKDPTFVGPDGPVKVTKIDDYTVEFKFGEPNSLFPQNLAYGFGYYPTAYPKHYLSQFMEKYNPDVQKLVDAEPAASDWVQLFSLKAGAMDTPAFWQNPDRPTLHAWHLINAYGSTDQVVAVRNPYYWKVDEKGQQLPYIDRITYDQVQDVNSILLKAFNGEIDFQTRHIQSPAFKAELTDNMDRGKYHFFAVNDLPSGSVIIELNLNNEDPVKRQVVNDLNFRIGLSYAVNRQEMIDLLYFGSGHPAQTSPVPGSPLYKEWYNKQYTEFDPAKANEYLDKVMPNKDAEGYRLGPDGKRFTLTFLVADVFGMHYPDAMDMIAKYAKNVGLDIQVRATDRSRLINLTTTNQQDAYLWNCGGGQSDAYTQPLCYVPLPSNSVNWARKWAEWGIDHTTGEEPPEYVKEIFQAYADVRTATTPEEQQTRMEHVLDLAEKQLFTIGIMQNDPVSGIVRNNVKNVLDPMPIAGQLWFPAPYVDQMYFEGGKNLP